MQYPDDFREACRLAYPDWTELHAKLNEGASIAGRYLDDSRRSGVANDFILSGASLSEIQAQARLNRARDQVYVWWYSLYEEQYPAKQ